MKERELSISFMAHGYLDVIKAEMTDKQILELLGQPGEKIIIDRSSGDVLQLMKDGTIGEFTPDTLQSDRVMNFFKEEEI